MVIEYPYHYVTVYVCIDIDIDCLLIVACNLSHLLLTLSRTATDWSIRDEA